MLVSALIFHVQFQCRSIFRRPSENVTASPGPVAPELTVSVYLALLLPSFHISNLLEADSIRISVLPHSSKKMEDVKKWPRIQRLLAAGLLNTLLQCNKAGAIHVHMPLPNAPTPAHR